MVILLMNLVAVQWIISSSLNIQSWIMAPSEFSTCGVDISSFSFRTPSLYPKQSEWRSPLGQVGGQNMQMLQELEGRVTWVGAQLVLVSPVETEASTRISNDYRHQAQSCLHSPNRGMLRPTWAVGN